MTITVEPEVGIPLPESATKIKLADPNICCCRNIQAARIAWVGYTGDGRG